MALRAQGDDYEHKAVHAQDGHKFVSGPAVAEGKWVGPVGPDRGRVDGSGGAMNRARTVVDEFVRPANPAGPPAYEAAAPRPALDISAGWLDVRASPPPVDQSVIACWADGRRAGAMLVQHSPLQGVGLGWVSNGHACAEPFFWMEIPAPPPGLMVKMRQIADLQRQIDEIRRS